MAYRCFLRNVFSVLCSTVLTATAFAQEGPYAGIDVGYGVSYGTLTMTPSNGSTPRQMAHTIEGPTYGIYGGYGFELPKNFYMGVEAFAHRSNEKWTNNLVTNYSGSGTAGPTYLSRQNLRKQWEFGVSLLPGYQIDASNLIYVRLGVTHAEFSGTSSGAWWNQIFVPTFLSFDQKVTGYQLGLGYALNLTPQWRMRAESIYTRYPTIHLVQPQPSQPPVTEYVSVPLKELRFDLGMDYSFAGVNPYKSYYVSDRGMKWSGWYAGIDGGFFTGGLRTQAFTGESASVFYRKDFRQSFVGHTGDLHIGYAFLHEPTQLYLATEASVMLAHAKGGTYNPYEPHGPETQKFDYTLRSYYSVSVLPGYLITQNNLIYARLGLVGSRASAEIADLSSNVSTLTRNLMGRQFGLGYEVALNPKISARMEYDMTFYNGFGYSFVGSGTNQQTTTFTPQTQQFTVGLNYRFG